MSPMVLLAQRAARNEADPLTIGLIGLLVVAVIVCISLWQGRRRNAAASERDRNMLAEQQRIGQLQQERDEKAYSQHVSLNDLTAEKLEAETKVLEAQLAAMERDRVARERDEEFNQLMVQKAKLEIQSLQLHIREQRKRIDDFTSYDDE